jgi:CDP-diacylglycerol--serine O-phosphatidyltransferase
MKRQIPNLITLCNLLCGVFSCIYAYEDTLHIAALFICLGIFFDFFDGMAARLLDVASPIGKELDSLADDVTFGVAPSAIVYYELTVMDYPAFLEPLRPVLPYAAFVMAAFSALRLAKFNLDERQTTSFIGLPTPANALFWGALMVGGSQWVEASPYHVMGVLAMLLVSCYLLVSEIPMFALKFKQWGWKGNEVKYLFIASSALLILLLGVKGIAVVIAWYVILSVTVSRKGQATANNE